MTDVVVGDQFRAEEQADSMLLSCRVRGHRPGNAERLWFRIPHGVGGPPAEGLGDPFLPALLLLAMKCGRPLVLEADASAALVAGAGRVMQVVAEWSDRAGDGLRPVPLRIPVRPRHRRGALAAAFFTGGVDSAYTLARNHARYPQGDCRRISQLIMVHGFDIGLQQGEFFREVVRRLEEVASGFGAAVVVAATNARECLRDLDWLRYAQGPATLGVGLGLAALFHTVYVAAGRAVTRLEPVDAALHPGLVPWWSTETLEFAFDGAEVTRAAKVQFLASYPLILRHLRVCWQAADGHYNCGSCEKCLWTMLDLYLCGALAEGLPFPSRLDPAVVAGVEVPARHRVYWREFLAELRSRGTDPELGRAVEACVRRGTWQDSRLGRLDAAASAGLARVGLSPARLARLDRVALGGSGRRLLRWIRERATRGAVLAPNSRGMPDIFRAEQ